ncbi:uncharacterized protein LOC120249891 [Dioscorea cayenensis subsp. rotundata]|uniref:Uncharacterized protein LOC120249891 n=1 Tax=Dioscorea cayennensis subsp. rotundata TaxID=55577 RepID=A0AB40AHU8_DIOCR|nr:uncharacterized protein LOC120249891 [Dioscorea cayenensis subsp. rotundata]
MATQVENGLKCDKTFKPQAIHAAIRALRENFGKDCTESNIHNHLRTLKRNWAIISRLREMSGVGWDEENKKIIMGEEECMTYLMRHPNEEPYINKPIEDYDLLEVVCGNDHVTGRFARDSIETPPTDDSVPKFSKDNFNIGLTQEDLVHGQFDNNFGFETPSPTPNSSTSCTLKKHKQERKAKRDASADSRLWHKS